jgi:hypothetical protein
MFTASLLIRQHLQARQMVDGLGHGGSDAETDFVTIVYQLRCVS